MLGYGNSIGDLEFACQRILVKSKRQSPGRSMGIQSRESLEKFYHSEASQFISEIPVLS